MIHKSYLVEENFENIKNNLILFYGENLGLMDDFKNKILDINARHQILRFSQDDILKNLDIFIQEIKNVSLFNDKKIFLINNVNDKIFKIIQEIIPDINENKFFLFAEILDKKSKLRNFFEKEKKTDIIPCYEDNYLSIKNIIKKKLKDYTGLTSEIINMITENCNNNRIKLKNEIQKIKTYFDNKIIDSNKLMDLLNLQENENFNNVKDSAFNGKKQNTNQLLNTTIIESEKSTLYVTSIYQRLIKLREIIDKNTDNNIEKTINKIRPPIFWKDKPNIANQAKIWNKDKLNKAINITYDIELKIKSNSNLDRKIMLKKLIVDVCNLANS